QGPISPDVMRRRLIAVAIVVAMIVAAVVGVVLASPGKPARHGPTQAQIRAAQQRAAEARRKAAAAAAATAAANKQLVTILTSLALTRNRNLTRLLNEQTPTSQVRDVATVQKAYVSAMHKVTPLQSKTPKAAPLAKTLMKIAGDYSHVVAAGRANKAGAFKSAYAQALRDEKLLRREAGEL
ncbi:MAG: hypothetical protein ACRDPM_15170, partial [Solirubrobacteraceae bacterium]